MTKVWELDFVTINHIKWQSLHESNYLLLSLWYPKGQKGSWVAPNQNWLTDMKMLSLCWLFWSFSYNLNGWSSIFIKNCWWKLSDCFEYSKNSESLIAIAIYSYWETVTEDVKWTTSSHIFYWNHCNDRHKHFNSTWYPFTPHPPLPPLLS